MPGAAPAGQVKGPPAQPAARAAGSTDAPLLPLLLLLLLPLLLLLLELQLPLDRVERLQDLRLLLGEHLHLGSPKVGV